MKLLLDTHLVLWAAYEPRSLSPEAASLLADMTNELIFSATTIWETAIKSSLGRSDFTADPRVLRRALLDNGYLELAVTGAHAAGVTDLPDLHRDPFDRMLVAQARAEGFTLLTSDRLVAAYGSPTRLV